MQPINYDVPFYANTPDNTHCFQATFKMVVKYYMPKVDFTWQQLDKVTAKQKDLWTWPMTGLNWLTKQGFDVLSIEDFDYAAFIAALKGYLIEKNGTDVAKEQVSHSNIPAEVMNAKQFLKTADIHNRLPTMEEMTMLLHDSYLLIANVNSKALNDRSGYTGHFIVVIGVDKDGFIVHDPGLPAQAGRHIQFEHFQKAWAYPNVRAKNLVAVRHIIK
jgi:hypothetical protein